MVIRHTRIVVTRVGGEDISLASSCCRSAAPDSKGFQIDVDGSTSQHYIRSTDADLRSTLDRSFRTRGKPWAGRAMLLITIMINGHWSMKDLVVAFDVGDPRVDVEVRLGVVLEILIEGSHSGLYKSMDSMHKVRQIKTGRMRQDKTDEDMIPPLLQISIYIHTQHRHLPNPTRPIDHPRA